MYQRLCTEFYDADKPEADLAEVDYFAGHVQRARGPVLEAMCGSGRLLIPLLKRGLHVEGVDNSPEMLASLGARCRQAGLISPVAHAQSIVALSLPHRYALIFIALGSIQLLPEELLPDALAGLRASLLDGGLLVVDTFIPWELIRSEEAVHEAKRKVMAPGGMIHLHQATEVDKARKRYVWRNRYERNDETEEETLTVRWYEPDELLEKFRAAGFTAECRGIPVTSPTPRRYLYEARA